MPEDTLDVMYVRGAHTSADIDQSEVVAIERARIKLARNLQSDINTIKGVGTKTRKYLQKKKIERVKDLLWDLPYSFIDRSKI